jgi:hypothetical protein
MTDAKPASGLGNGASARVLMLRLAPLACGVLVATRGLMVVLARRLPKAPS